MNQLKTISLFALLALLLLGCGKRDGYNLQSPDGRLEVCVELDDDGLLYYRLQVDKGAAIDSSRLGYRLKDGTEFPSAGWAVAKEERDVMDREWVPVWGKRAVVADRYSSLTLSLENRSQPEGINHLSVELRLYDDGLAFRYHFPDSIDAPAERELTEYRFTTNPTAWFYNGEQANYGPFKLSEVEGIRPSNVTLQLSDSLYMHLHEACLLQGDPLKLAAHKGDSVLAIGSSPGVFGTLKGGYTSAWRVVMTGKTPGALTDSHLIELLNPNPAPDMDFSWVKPGMAVWDWRIDGAEWEGFTYGMNYPSWIKMVDFSAEQGFNHLVLDANWYGPEFEKDSDPVKGDKANDVQRLLAYAKTKEVGVWLYLNDVGGRKFPIEQTLKQYGDWGAAGVKYGFMQGTAEEKNGWTQHITQLCAENRLLVDFHDGPVHPYGQMRTWPNAVTREFCHAQLDAHRVFTPTTFCTTVFVNMVAGPIDMNNGMFDLRQGHTTRVDESQPVPSTLVSEAARTLITFSGATILPDIPEYYHKYPELIRFLSAQQMPWRESRTLDGQIGQYIVMMRQTDSAFLVAAATNELGRTITLPLHFLPEGTYRADMVEDGDKAHYLTNRECLKSRSSSVSNQDTLTLTLAPGGGACLTFRAI